MIRDDLSANLIHLTRGESDQAAADAFLSIFNSQQLLGSVSDIRGGYKYVCFSEEPLAKLAYLLASTSKSAMRYKPFGVMLAKRWLFEKGARPVIYQPEAEYKLLSEPLRYRHARYEPGKVDYTWEREWRTRADAFALEPDQITFIVPTRAWEQWAQQKHAESQYALNIASQGFVPTKSIPWHFAVLEDMGVAIESVDPPLSPTSNCHQHAAGGTANNQ
jgi:hypothetical protein